MERSFLLDQLVHCFLQSRHCEGLLGIAERNPRARACHNIRIGRLVAKDRNHRQRHTEAQSLMHAVGTAMCDEGMTLLQQLQLRQHSLRDEIFGQRDAF
eukprot:Skav216028  [mRNA]  locus=scaffold417:130769:131065:- [translate_table: standard]